ncbi:hypothetical protein [Parasphingorhabdus cellanae]|uniref:Secreted protein n=1 Tax=Parasphingorhabdus cellanae TaxID=2806553 RepID=A0ABX7T325_9SPHN|nr:hypothetical protein [Parasphingorhabdus cellanae]QTD55220.1 hypothetical protein J4G78_13460 [Parasphingorhabdus cellanae]
MKMTKLLAASAAVAALAVGAPAMAQQNQGNDVYDNADSLVINDLLDIYLAQDASTTTTVDDVASNNNNNNDLVIATQTLTAYNTNSLMDELVDLDGEDGTPAPVGYNSGDNYVRGNAFAAFAGILNQSWNTGINSNAQSATNIAAQGTINFGDGAAAAEGGAGGGD